jgi:glutamyl-tRNA synthetase|tara:strand:- start:2209 stop:3747 length:1539 start_codon:yes stop_codon:yes gene_type:complete
MSKVRLRFAPSPTGPLHIGGLRTALYNYLIAQSLKGSFILRIEDTDQNRFDERAEKHITESLLWSKIIPDESPYNPGEYGPYRQSERKEIYQKYVQRLINEGKAYYAFDEKEQLEKLRSEHENKGETFIYNWKNRRKLRNSISLNKDEIKKELEKEDYVVRFNSYEEKNKNEFIILEDEIRGKIKVDLKILDDKIILKNDGMPTYHLANVVDDHLMEISHVIRGEEWLPSLALHELLYNAFQWEKPIFAHLPLILKPTGKGKLSKRDGEKFGIPVYPIEWKESENLTYKGFKEIGFEIEAFINFICMIGWNPGTEDEIFTLESLTKIFDTKRIIKSGAKYDYEKAKWFNLEHLKKIETHSLNKEFGNKISEINKDFLQEKMLNKLIDLAKNRINFRKDLVDETNKILSYNENRLRENLLKINFNNELINLIEFFQKEIKRADNLKDLKEKYFLEMKSLNIKVGDGMKSLRLSLTSEISGADLFTIIEILKIEIINFRLNKSLKIMYDKSRNN